MTEEQVFESNTDIEDSSKDIVICDNCGAEYDAHAAACPFCGYINPLGAEEKYMQKMQDIKSDLAQVDDEQIDAIKDEAKKSSKIVIITIVVVAVLLLVGVFLFNIYNSITTARATAHYDSLGLYEDDPLEAAKWNDEHMADLDSMYETGDIEGLVAYYAELAANKDYGAFNSWEHGFMVGQIYDMRFWLDCYERDQKLDDLVYHNIMFNLLYYYNGDYKKTTMPQEDYKFVEDEVQRQMKQLGISEDSLKELQAECLTDYGSADPVKVSDYCDSHEVLIKK